MPARIQLPFGALARCLDLKESLPQVTLHENALPVVVLCQNYGQESLFIEADRIGAGVTTAATGPLRAGTYDIVLSGMLINAGALLTELFFGLWNTGLTARRGRLAIFQQDAIGRFPVSWRGIINVREGEQLAVSVTGAQVSDRILSSVSIQPL